MDPEARETARLGDWTIRATAIVRQEHRRPRQVALLHAPPGFAGRARLGVSDSAGREEFAHAWAPDDPSPLIFTLPISEAGARADLILEIAAARGPERASPEIVTGPVAFTRVRADARIYLASILEARGAGGSGALGVLRALGRERGLRAAWDRGWMEGLEDPSARETAEALVRSGRLEILESTAPEMQAALPFPPRTRLTAAPPEPGEPPESVRGVLLTGPEAARWAVALHPALERLPFRVVAGARSLPACVVPAPCVIDARMRPVGASAALAIDEILRWQPPAGPAPASPQLRPPAFCALPLRDGDDLRALADFVRGWNRRHISPRLQPATPADYFALLEELEARHALALPRVQLA